MTRHPAFSHALHRPARLRSDVARLAHLPRSFRGTSRREVAAAFAVSAGAAAHVSGGFASCTSGVAKALVKGQLVGRSVIPGPDRAGPEEYASARRIARRMGTGDRHERFYESHRFGGRTKGVRRAAGRPRFDG